MLFRYHIFLNYYKSSDTFLENIFSIRISVTGR